MPPRLFTIALTLPACIAPHPLRSQGVSQRAVISADSSTTQENTLALELGVDWDPSDSSNATASLLFGAGPRTELFVDVSPYAAADLGLGNETGVGDVVVGVRHILAQESAEGPAYALHLATKIPTAEDASGLGTGEFDAFFAGSASRAFELAYVSAYYEIGILGEPDASTAIQHLWAFSAAQGWTDQLGGVVEFASIADSDRPDSEPLTLTTSLVWQASPRCAIDVGAIWPLDDDAGDTHWVFGAALIP